jgi:uncharacterized protein (DUF2249 family)
MMIAMQEIDVRIIPPKLKHRTIYQTLQALPLNETLRIVNDHDPRPLRFELDADYPHAFAWQYVESGPDRWLVEIRKLVDLPAPTDAYR